MPDRIILRKLSTRDDAESPQKEKYPDGTERKGFMWDFSKPKVGSRFYVLIDKLTPYFITSPVEEILEEREDKIVFKTLNSTYEIEIL